MASFGKKKRVDNEETMEQKLKTSEGTYSSDEADLNDEEESENDSSDEEINEEIQVEFEALPPQHEDFHGIRKLLQQQFLKSCVNLSEFAELIISQNFIGCVIKQSEAQLMEEMEDDDDDDDDDDIFGFITVLNIQGLQHKPCMQQVLDIIHAKCKESADQSTQAEMNQFLTSGQHKVGLLLNERFVNIPPQLAPPLHRSLQNDLTKASAKNEKYKVDYFLMMSKSYQLASAPKKKKKGGGDEKEESGMFFANAEDEIFFRESILNFHYSITEDSDTAIAGKWSANEEEFRTFRTVMIVPASKMDSIVTEIEETLSG